MMRADFIRRGFDVPDAGAQAPGIAAPRFSRSTDILAEPGFGPGFVVGGASGSFSYCDGSRYARTWWLHPVVEARRERYFDIMAAVACEYQVPTALLDAVIAQESGYKSWAISDAGAMGMMQIMPGTARYLGLTTPFDAVANLRAGARYLKEQLDRFGRVDLALAAYNAGPHRRTLAAGLIPRIPETLNYVRTISVSWARLAAMAPASAPAIDRGAIAAQAVRATGYRSVELIRYDGSNAASPI
ncbi:MAG: lytic transglycosylase domain-containing protein [Sphingomonadaceae bacterium]|nr:lytic transglycosylase domain-containing protein [Sphingomonadaceae bacterium]